MTILSTSDKSTLDPTKRDIHSSTRLGDLLLEQGLITRNQLHDAIALQRARYEQSVKINAEVPRGNELGAILVELGYITPWQLKRSLGWQRRLRKTTAIMVFIAPLLTAACGGGASGSSAPSGATSTQTSLIDQSTVSPSGTATGVETPGVASSSAAFSSTPGKSSATPITSSAAVSSAPGMVTSPAKSSASSKATSSVNTSSAGSVSSNSPQAAGDLDGPVQLYWSAPTARENGEPLDITEVGGYEVRYKLKSANTYDTIRIDDGYADAYYFDYLQGDYEFEIASFDREGLYSEFVQINPY